MLPLRSLLIILLLAAPALADDPRLGREVFWKLGAKATDDDGKEIQLDVVPFPAKAGKLENGKHWLEKGWLAEEDVLTSAEALAWYTEQIRHNEQDARLRRHRAAICRVTGDLIAALADADEAVRLDPAAPAGYAVRAQIRLDTGANDQAIADASEAIRRAPKSPDGYLVRARISLTGRAYENAIADCHRALDVDPTNAAAHRVCGEACCDRGDYDQAIEQLGEAIRLDPQIERPYVLRAQAWLETGQPGEAIADCQAALRRFPDSAVIALALAKAFLQADGLDEALDYASGAIELDPNNPDAYLLRGAALAMQGNYEGAIADFRQCCQLDPDSAACHFNWGSACSATGDFKAAIDQFTQAIGLAPESMAYIGRAKGYAKLLAFGEAVADFKAALRLDPGAAQAHYGLASILATCPDDKFRDGRLAIEHATKACELTEWKNPAGAEILAAAYAEAGDFTSAIAWQEKATAGALSDDEKAEGEERLALYRAGKPYHEKAAK